MIWDPPQRGGGGRGAVRPWLRGRTIPPLKPLDAFQALEALEALDWGWGAAKTADQLIDRAVPPLKAFQALEALEALDWGGTRRRQIS